MRIARLLVVLLLVAPAVQAQTAAPASIDQILERGELERAHWGVHAIDARTGAVVYSRNADQLFVPASNLKLMVAAAGAHYLGADLADPGRYLATVFLELLEANGIDVAATLGRAVFTPAPAPSGTALFTWTAAPLPVTIAPILLTSQNWFGAQSAEVSDAIDDVVRALAEQ